MHRIAPIALVVTLALAPVALADPEPAAAPAAPAAPAAGEPEEEVIEEATVEVETPKAPPTAFEYTGRLHPMLVHMPIAWLFLLLLIDLVTFTPHPWLAAERNGLARFGAVFSLLTLAACLPALATGLINAEHHTSADAHELEEIIEHRNAAFVAVGLLAAGIITRFALRPGPLSASRWAYLVLIVAAFAVLSGAGHEGGKLVYGEDYLPF